MDDRVRTNERGFINLAFIRVPRVLVLALGVAAHEGAYGVAAGGEQSRNLLAHHARCACNDDGLRRDIRVACLKIEVGFNASCAVGKDFFEVACCHLGCDDFGATAHVAREFEGT